ncbi:MAG: type VI secretion system protein TssA [Pikeienuella sp.]
MSLELDKLLASFGEDGPAGEDLEYDPAFIDLELAAMPKDEQQIGDQVIAAEEPDYKEVMTHAVTVLERSKDLRAAVFYANAALRIEGLTGLAEAMTYIKRCCEEYWDDCHPRLVDDDGDYDPTMRMNAIAGLAGNETVLRGLRVAPITDSRGFGRMTLRDLLMARGEITQGDEEEHIDTNAISAAFQDTPRETLVAIDAAITDCRDTLKALDTLLSDHVGEMSPDLTPLARLLYDLKQNFEHFAADLIVDVEEFEPEEETEADQDAGIVAEGGGNAAPVSGGGRAVGAIGNRRDVVNALDKIIEYYRRHEPTSPVPHILGRAKRLVSADFMTVLEDLAPDGIDRFRMIAGIEDE